MEQKTFMCLVCNDLVRMLSYNRTRERGMERKGEMGRWGGGRWGGGEMGRWGDGEMGREGS